MGAKVAVVTEENIADMNTVIEYQDVANENKEVKSLTTGIRKNKILTYIANFIKRTIDILAGIAGAIILMPLTIGVYIANKISKEDGPIFYTQERIGKNGKTFKMLKYRSMVMGADEKLEKYLAENEEARKEYKKYKKLKKDPRITKMGKILRKTSLDEMPQLLHLLTGDMSLVGPRPYLPREKEEMGEYYNVITKLKPGLTGYWQVSGRSETTFNERLDYDIKYYKDSSLKRDIKIIFTTMKHVVKKTGAL